MPLEITSTASESTPPKSPGIGLLTVTKRLKGKDRAAFTEQLGLMLETGTPLHQSIEALKRQASNPAMIELLDDLGEQIAAGSSFTSALSRHPEMFNATYVHLVAAGEHGGFLPQVLNELQGFDERQERLQGTLVSSLSYPAFLILFSILVIIFVLVAVFPKFEEMFDSIRDQLPLSTRILMSMSDLLRHYWMAIVVMGAGLLALIRAWSRTAQGRESLDWFKLKAPLLREVVVQVYLIQTFRVMSLSITHGVGIMDAFDACIEVIKNGVFRRFLSRVKAGVAEGQSITAGFNAAEFIPPGVRQMISTGENTGRLPEVMAKVADFYERDLEKRISLLSKIIEPLMLLVMGLVVGLIVSSLILPIFKLSRAMH
jgi:type II secretory pathway component PulF